MAAKAIQRKSNLFCGNRNLTRSVRNEARRNVMGLTVLPAEKIEEQPNL